MPQAMSKTQRLRFIRICEDQGIRVTPTKKGLLIRFPDGSSTVQHFTNSDVRAEQNQIARFRRAGMTHPNDTRPTESLPAYITSGSISRKTKQKIVDYVASQGYPESILSSAIVKDLKMDPGWANRALYHSGFRPGPAKSRKVGRPWYTPDEILCLKPEEKDVLDVATENTAAATDDYEKKKIADMAFDPGVDPGLDDVMPTNDTREQEESVPLPEPEVVQEPQADDIQFIDVRDSWVVDMKDLFGGTYYMIEDKLKMLGVLGMDYEFRVWRK